MRVREKSALAGWHGSRQTQFLSHPPCSLHNPGCTHGDKPSAHQRAIPIPPCARIGEGQHVRVLLLVDDAKLAPTQTTGSEEVFHLLTELSDDFMADGRWRCDCHPEPIA
jgi:hypothetical protein